jgi:ferritin-like metal-binding protein YciE
MPAIDSLQTLLVEQLKDVYDAEKRLTKAIPKLAKAASSDELRSALQSHLSETEEHVSRLEEAFELLEERPKSKPCAGMRGLIEEGETHSKEDYEDDGLRDAVIIGSAQRVEHYEIAAYGTMIAHARLLGLDEVVSLLGMTLEEEKAADQKLTEIAETVVNPDAADRDEEMGRTSTRGRSTPESLSMAADRSGRATKRTTQPGRRPMRRVSSGR